MICQSVVVLLTQTTDSSMYSMWVIYLSHCDIKSISFSQWHKENWQMSDKIIFFLYLLAELVNGVNWSWSISLKGTWLQGTIFWHELILTLWCYFLNKWKWWWKKKVVPSSVILLSSLPQKGTCLWPPKGLMILVPLFCICIDYSILFFH